MGSTVPDINPQVRTTSKRRAAEALRRIAGLCRVVFILRPSQRLWFLVNRQARQGQRICSLESVRRVASEGWTAWKACGTGWAQVDPAPSENSRERHVPLVRSGLPHASRLHPAMRRKPVGEIAHLIGDDMATGKNEVLESTRLIRDV